MNITEIDKAVIRSTIERQIEAFLQDNAQKAFSLASRGIQVQFSTPQNFMTMVKTAYYPLYRPRALIFENLIVIEGFPAQTALLMDNLGKLHRSVYLMQKQLEGDWRVHGCCLMPLEDFPKS